jgi:hypothetical protein
MNAKKENQGLWLLLIEIIHMIAFIKNNKNLVVSKVLIAFRTTFFVPEP